MADGNEAAGKKQGQSATAENVQRRAMLLNRLPRCPDGETGLGLMSTQTWFTGG
jgi:hypothetical protein